MKTFTVPVVITIAGWVSVEAKCLVEARLKAGRLNHEGVDQDSIQDPTYSSECMVEEIRDA